MKNEKILKEGIQHMLEIIDNRTELFRAEIKKDQLDLDQLNEWKSDIEKMISSARALCGGLQKLKTTTIFLSDGDQPVGEVIEDNCGERTWKVIK